MSRAVSLQAYGLPDEFVDSIAQVQRWREPCSVALLRVEAAARGLTTGRALSTRARTRRRESCGDGAATPNVALAWPRLSDSASLGANSCCGIVAAPSPTERQGAHRLRLLLARNAAVFVLRIQAPSRHLGSSARRTFSARRMAHTALGSSCTAQIWVARDSAPKCLLDVFQDSVVLAWAARGPPWQPVIDSVLPFKPHSDPATAGSPDPARELQSMTTDRPCRWSKKNDRLHDTAISPPRCQALGLEASAATPPIDRYSYGFDALLDTDLGDRHQDALPLYSTVTCLHYPQRVDVHSPRTTRLVDTVATLAPRPGVRAVREPPLAGTACSGCSRSSRPAVRRSCW